MPMFRPKGSPDILILDGMNMAFKAFHAVKGLSYQGRDTSTLKGLMASLVNLVERFAPKHIVVVWEGKRGKKRRKDIIPEYKEGRASLTDDQLKALFWQVDIFRELCFYLGLSAVSVEGYEADDAMHCLSQQLADTGKRVVIVTSDKDLVQSIRKGVDWYDTTKDLLLNTHNSYSRLGVRLGRYVDYKCLVKDDSDNLSGVPGIGPKTAKEALQGSSLQELMDNPPEKGRLSKLGSPEVKEVVEKMRKVVDLDYFITPEFQEEVQKQANKCLITPDWEEVWDILEEIGFFQILDKFPDFKDSLAILDIQEFIEEKNGTESS